MAAERSNRRRDERGRFLPGEEAEEGREDGAAAQEPEREASAEKGDRDSKLTAPSVGPKTKIDRPPPEERLAKHEQSEVDAMGFEKRREVVGKSYGPSFAKQATVYGIFIAVVATVSIGFYLLARELDQPPETTAVEAPWAQPGAEQVPVRPLDFPRNGQTDVGAGAAGPADEGPQ